MNLFQHIRRDLPASIVVFFVAVPLCLGIALASGVPLFAGVIAGIIGGILVGSLSGSPLGVSGPAAGLIVIVVAAIESLGFPAFLAAVVIAGVFQIILGVLRCGVIAYFFPSSVIKGMLCGIGVIIIMKQIPHAVGHDSDPEGQLAFQQPDGDTTLSSFESMMNDLTREAILMSAICLGILILWDQVLSKKSKIFRIIQGPLVAVAFGIIYQVVMSKVAPDWAFTEKHLVTVPVVDGLAGFKELMTFPDFGALGDYRVWTTAFTLAIVASLETLLCVEATDKMDPERRVTPTNRELIAQGCGNIASGMIGGLPVTQVIVRSSANIQSGARTKMSAILHGVFLLIAVGLLPTLLNLVPLSVLASILLVVGYKLAKPALFINMFKAGWGQFVPFIVTILGIVFTDLLVGIGLGLGVAVAMLLFRSYKNSHFLHMKESEEPGRGHVVRMRLAEEVTFFNRATVLTTLGNIPDNSHVTIDASETVYLDDDVVELIAEFCESAPRRGIEVEYIEAPDTDPRARKVITQEEEKPEVGAAS